MTATTAELLDAASLPPGYRGVRGEILVAFKRAAGGLTAKDLADQLGVSLNAIRHHLKELEANHLILWRPEQRGVGAPVHVYLLSPDGENLFPRRYEVLLTEILAHVEGRNGRAAIVEAVEGRYLALTERLRTQLAGAEAQQRLEIVARILGEEGYMAEWNESNGNISLTEHNCAIKAVAQRFPEICAVEEKFLREVLGANVERRTHILSGCQSCEYSIQFPQAGPDGDTTAPGLPPQRSAPPVA